MDSQQITITLNKEDAKEFLSGKNSTILTSSIKEALAALSPVIEEPTYPGAVVMTDEGIAVRVPVSTQPWYVSGYNSGSVWRHWAHLVNPRPLTPAECREHSIPETLPKNHIAMQRVISAWWSLDDWRSYAKRMWNSGDYMAGNLCDIYADALEAADGGEDE